MKPENKKFIKVWETDASGIIGNATDVFIPVSIAEIKEIVRLNQNIVIRGGGSGLVGGCVPFDSVVLDLSKFNKILNFDKQRKTIEVESGIVLSELNLFLDEYNLEFPVKPSSHEICTIGGMIATDAVGSRAGKYGRTSKWVEELEIINSRAELRKIGKAELSDYTGLEGITGIIIKAKLKLEEKKIRTASILALQSLQEVVEVTRQLKLEDNISMIEFFDKFVSRLLGLEDKYHLIIEYESNQGKLRNEKYEEVMSLRDRTYPLLAKQGYLKIEDPKILIDRFLQLAECLEENKIPYFGHLSVGIIHPCFKLEQEKEIRELMRIVRKLHGQVSGEHGIGIRKKQFLDEFEKKLYYAVKKRCDPLNKFNSGKII